MTDALELKFEEVADTPLKLKGNLLLALAQMPDEAFGWFTLAAMQGAMTGGALTQIWPDGDGGFSVESREAIEAVRCWAGAFNEAKREATK